MKVISRRSTLWVHPVSLLLYTIVTLWLTWPLASQLKTALAGSSADAYMHYWNSWWVRQALTTGQSIFHTSYLFYPDGASLVYQNIAWLNVAPWLVLQTVLDDLLAYNIVFLLQLLFCAYAAFLLARKLTGNYLAAFVAGLVYLAWPYRLSQLDHPNLISTGWMPLFFLFLIMASEGKRVRDAVLAGICLALIGFTRWQLLIPMFFVIFAYLLATLPNWIRDRRSWSSLAITAGVAILLLAPPAWLLFSRTEQPLAETTVGLLREGEESIMHTDLLAYVVPQASHPLLGRETKPLIDAFYPERTALRRFPAYVGLITLLLSILALRRKLRASLPWLLMALLLMLLALGPVVRLNGHLYPELPTLYRVLEPLYFVRLIRIPERFNIALALPAAMLAGYGLTTILDWLSRHRWNRSWLPYATAAALGLIIIFDYAPGDAQLQSTQLSSYYEQLAAEPGDFAVLSLPIDSFQAKEQMLAQTVHNRPLVHGRITRPTVDTYAFIDQHTLLSVLRQSSEMPSWLTDVGQQLASLAEAGITTIIFHKDQIGADRIEHWRRYVGLDPVYEDESIAVFSTEPIAGQDFHILQELVPGLGPVKTLVTGSCFAPGQPLEVDVLWGTSSALAAGHQVHIGIHTQSGQVLQSHTFPLASPGSANSWPVSALVWGYYPLEIEPDTQPGDYQMSLWLDDTSSAPIFDLGSLTVSEDTCPTSLPEQAVSTDALFGKEMRLLGYEVTRPSPQQLSVTLHWRGEQRMATNYKVFVHVFDTITDIPVAQDDAEPNRGGFPTRFWSPGDLVTDHIPIDLSQAQPGEYGIAVGIYDPLTQERLPLLIDRRLSPEDRRLVLPGEMVTIER